MNANTSRFAGTIGLAFFVSLAGAQNINDDDPQPTLERGATTYSARCALCHGTEAYGDGPLALTIKDYPQSDLTKPRYAKDINKIRDAIVNGGNTSNKLSNLMPPWGAELSWTEVESLVMFMGALQRDPTARSVLRKVAAQRPPDRLNGRRIFQSHCAQCHGKEGRGDGRLSKMIKNPPPFNLTYSGMPDDYLFQIIKTGGQNMGRSPQMPPWGDELTDTDIRSVILYIKEFRGRH